MAEIRAQVDINVKQNGKTTSSKNSIKAKAQEQKALNKEIKSSGNLMDKFNKALKSSSIAGWAKLIAKTTNFMIEASKAQADYAENLNLMQVAFGKTSEQAENFVNSLSQSIGLDTSAITRQLGVFRQMTDAMGYSAEVADLLSTNLSKMQLDIASLYNLDFKRAGNALEGALTGQTKTIRSLTGADITEATLQQYALSKGIDESVHSMTRAEKALLIYLSLEEQFANANGDLSRTVNSVSNQIKIFKEQIAIAGRQLGAVFIPLLKLILPVLNGILMAFNELVAMFLTLIGADASALTDEFGITTGGLNEIEDGLNGISTASKEAKKSLRGFDKLNNITTPTSSISGGSLSGGINEDLINSLKEYNLQLEKMKNKATKIKENIMAWLGFSKNVNGEWEFSKVTFGTIAGIIGTGLIGASVIKGIVKVLGFAGANGVGGAGLLGISSVLKYIAGLGMITITIYCAMETYKKLKEYKIIINEVKEAIDNLNKTNDLLLEKDKEIAKTTIEKIKTGEIDINTQKSLISIQKDKIDSGTLLIQKTRDQISWLGQYTGINDKARESLEKSIETNASYIESIVDMSKNTELTKNEQDKLTSSIANAIKVAEENSIYLGENSEAYKKAKENIDKMKNSLKTLTSQNYNTDLMIKTDIDTSKANNKVTKFINEIKENLSKLFGGFGSFGGGLSISGGARAEGGFVDTGQLFVAREKGPEMVGTIGGHTAVANNDQIVEAISVGVAKAMMATGGKNTTVNITAEGDASGLLNFINFQQKEKDRQFGLG